MTTVAHSSAGETGISGAISEADIALRIRGVHKSFADQEVLRGIDLDVRRGEFLTLLGPSGSGKTTLLRIIAGFESSSSGNMQLQGRDIAALSPSQRDLGMVFQQYALFPHLTVAQNVGYGLRMRRWSEEKIRVRVNEMLEIISLGHLASRRPRQLSGGQQQRVALARALAYEPALLLMDEPLGALDRNLRLQMEEEIRRVHRQLGTTVIYVTHDQEEALVLSDRVAIMKDGQLAGLDTPGALYHRPPSAFVAKFFSHSNVIPAVATDGPEPGTARIAVADSDFHVKTRLRGPVALAVRPRSLGPASGQEGLTVQGTVVESLLLGDDQQVKLDVPGLGIVVALMDVNGASMPTAGDRITLVAAPEDVTVVSP
jgi:putative spermidine/putrescine transport system ATP-binding protein